MILDLLGTCLLQPVSCSCFCSSKMCFSRIGEKSPKRFGTFVSVFVPFPSTRPIGGDSLRSPRSAQTAEGGENCLGRVRVPVTKENFLTSREETVGRV